MKKQTWKAAVSAAVICVAAASPSLAGLVAKWDFDNYDSENPTSAAILAPTVGNLAAVPYTGTSTSTEVTDGTLGDITVLAPSETGLFAGDYALAIPNGAHLWMPLPSGIVSNKCWTIRIRFNMPSSSPTSLNTLISGQLDPVGNHVWFVSNLNLIQGSEGLFGTDVEENRNSTSKAGKGGKQNIGTVPFRQVSRDAWHTLAAHFGPKATSSTLDGYRSVSMLGSTDVRARFTGDGFVLCGGANTVTTYIASVEVWEDTPIYRDFNGAAYVPATSRKFFEGCLLEDIRDMYISVKILGTWGSYARTVSSWEHVVTSDGAGNVTDLKVDLRDKMAASAILCDFTDSGSDVAGNTLRMQWSLGWPNHYFTAAGAFTSSANYKAAGTSYDYDGYSAYNLYALPFRPLDGSLTWSMQMGSGKFGNPFFSIVGDNPTLTFDAAPQADSITLDCGRGDGQAHVTFAYASDALKTMSGLGLLNITDGVTLTIPPGVSITGALTFTAGAKMTIDVAGLSLSNGEVLFTAIGGITLPAGKTIADLVYVAGGSAELSQDGTQILLAPDPSIVVTAVWTGLGDRSNVSDPLNWTCYNYAGTILADRLPGEATSITVSGATTFNFPAGQTITYLSLTIQNCSLTADCNWSGFGAAIPFAANAAVNLDGHKLTVAGLAPGVAATIKNDNTETLSELHLDNATDTVNTQVAIAGNVKFVKMGTGRFTAGKGCTYTGGNELLEGVTYVSLNATQQATMGASGNEILVRNATLDLGGQVWYTIYGIVLDNGTISSAFSENISTYGGGAIIGDTLLLSNSTFQTTGNGNLRLWSGRSLDLGGNTLSVNLANATKFIVGTDVDDTTSVATISNGTFVVSGGTFMTQNYKGTINATATTMRMGCAINLPSMSTMNVRDYEALYAGTDNSGTGALNVYGTFKPSAHDKFYGCTMQNGSMIDLSSRTNALPLVSAFTTGANTLKFADNSTVYINAGNLKVGSKSPVITWDEKPENIRTVKFKNADTGSSRTFVSRDEGVFGISGFVIIVK